VSRHDNFKHKLRLREYAYDKCTVLVHYEDYAAMLDNLWYQYRPGGVALSAEERGEFMVELRQIVEMHGHTHEMEAVEVHRDWWCQEMGQEKVQEEGWWCREEVQGGVKVQEKGQEVQDKLYLRFDLFADWFRFFIGVIERFSAAEGAAARRVS
jgi:hypothetical protein